MYTDGKMSGKEGNEKYTQSIFHFYKPEKK